MKNSKKDLTEEQKLAEAIHLKICKSNHIDQCGWHYGSWENEIHPRHEYLLKARNILKLVPFKTAIKVVENL